MTHIRVSSCTCLLRPYILLWLLSEQAMSIMQCISAVDRQFVVATRHFLA